MRFTKTNVSKLTLPDGKADFVHFDASLRFRLAYSLQWEKNVVYP